MKEGSLLVAQCLEWDVAVQANSIAELKKAFFRELNGHLALALEAGEEPFANMPEAPRWYWDLYENAHGLAPMDRIRVKPSTTKRGPQYSGKVHPAVLEAVAEMRMV